MCTRYVSPDSATIHTAWQLRIDKSEVFPRCFNVAPGATMPMIFDNAKTDEREMRAARWGYVPSWWHEPQIPGDAFNVDAEGAPTNGRWRDAYLAYRCLIPAEGWYVWKEMHTQDDQGHEADFQ